jgi:regulatory LuxR family protein
MIADGNSTKDIAATLEVRVETIETHRKQIMDKLDIRTIAGLTKYCIREGLTSLWNVEAKNCEPRKLAPHRANHLILHSSGIFSAAGGTQYGATPSIAMALVLARFSFHTKQQAIQDAQLFAEISEAHSHGFERVGWLQARIDHIFAVSLYVQAQSHSKLNPTEAYLCGFAGFFCLGNGSLDY